LVEIEGKVFAQAVSNGRVLGSAFCLIGDAGGP